MNNTLKILMTEQEKGRENMKQLITEKEKIYLTLPSTKVIFTIQNLQILLSYYTLKHC